MIGDLYILLLMWIHVAQSQNGNICLYSAFNKRADCTPTPEFGDFRFSTIPNDLDDFVETIVMTNNEITSLYPGNLTYYTNLKRLELTSNLITEIPIGLVAAPTTLESLILDNNPLSKIEDEAFVNMNSLVILSLKSTQLSTLTAETLKGLTVLEELYLDSSSISSVSSDLFSSINSIRMVSFASSQLVTLPSTLFDDVGLATVMISLAGNPWSCDCYLSFLRSLITDYPSFPSDRDELTCRWPENVRNIKMEVIADDQFDCYSPTIVTGPQDESITTNQSFTLSCEVDGAPFPETTWIKDGVVVTLDDRVYLNQFDGSLHWTNTILNDAGTYSCQVINANGTDSSLNATLKVTEVTCFDKSKSSHETDIDCGGIYCSPCNQTQTCLIDQDCRDDLVCLYSHELPSQLLYISPNDIQAYTCETPEIPRELLNTRIQNGLPVDVFTFNFTVEATIESVKDSIRNAIAEQLSVPVSTIDNVRMTTVERSSRDSIPLIQVWFNLMKTSDGKRGHKNLLELIDNGKIQGTIRIIENGSHYSIRLNL